MKEGRYVSQAPIGQANKSKENTRKYIAPKEPQASIIKWAFEEIAKGIFNTEEILRMARKKGLTVGKNAFWLAIRNPLYCGKIFVPKFKDEESQLVKGSMRQSLPKTSTIPFKTYWMGVAGHTVLRCRLMQIFH